MEFIRWALDCAVQQLVRASSARADAILASADSSHTANAVAIAVVEDPCGFLVWLAVLAKVKALSSDSREVR